MSDIQAIKYRLVGAVVIVVGFACIWWLMLDHEAHRRIKEEQVDIPQQTFAVERFDIEQPEPLGIRPQDDPAKASDTAGAEAKPADKNSEEIKDTEITAAVISPPQPEKVARETPVVAEVKPVLKPLESKAPVEVTQKTGSYSALDAKGLPEAWVLQLASLKSKENAQQLQRKLLASSYPAYVKSVSTADGISYRVLVGPKLSRQKAEEMASAIEKEHRIKSMIVRFQPGYEQ